MAASSAPKPPVAQRDYAARAKLVTRIPSPERPRSASPPEGALRKATRRRLCDVVSSVLRRCVGQKKEALSVAMGIDTSRVGKWFHAEWDWAAPLALLLVLEHDEFDAVVSELRGARSQ